MTRKRTSTVVVTIITLASSCATARAAWTERDLTSSGCIPAGLDATAVLVGLDAIEAGHEMPASLREDLLAALACLEATR